jgi:hypothetical protein
LGTGASFGASVPPAPVPPCPSWQAVLALERERKRTCELEVDLERGRVRAVELQRLSDDLWARAGELARARVAADAATQVGRMLRVLALVA